MPDLRYDDMEVSDGGTASRLLESMLLGSELGAAEKQAARAALFAYCAQDTRATMGVLQRLRRATR